MKNTSQSSLTVFLKKGVKTSYYLAKGGRATIYALNKFKSLDQLADIVAKNANAKNNHHHNAIGHAVGVALMVHYYGAGRVRSLGIAHEIGTKRRKNQNAHRVHLQDSYKDQWNNEIGIQIGSYAKEHGLSIAQIAGLTIRAYRNGRLINDEDNVRVPTSYNPETFNRDTKIPRLQLSPHYIQKVKIPALLDKKLRPIQTMAAYGEAARAGAHRAGVKNPDQAAIVAITGLGVSAIAIKAKAGLDVRTSLNSLRQVSGGKIFGSRVKFGGKIGLLVSAGLLAYGLYKSTRSPKKPAQPEQAPPDKTRLDILIGGGSKIKVTPEQAAIKVAAHKAYAGAPKDKTRLDIHIGGGGKTTPASKTGKVAYLTKDKRTVQVSRDKAASYRKRRKK